jgi:hypothetical protein
MRFGRSALLVACAGLCVAPGASMAAAVVAQPGSGGADGAVYRKLADNVAPAIVTLKFVVKVSGGAGEQEQESDATGVMIDAKGLVLVSDQSLGGRPAAWKRAGGTTFTAKDIKVLVGDDTEGLEAKIIGRDGDLDLAWVQIEKPEEKGYVAVDFAAGAEAAVGDRVLSVERMSKFFDRVPSISEGRLSAVVSKPRKLFIPSKGLGATFGTPIFNADGKPVGMSVLQLPSPEEAEGHPGGLRTLISEAILPSSEIAAATKRARDAAAAGKPIGEEAPEAPEAAGPEAGAPAPIQPATPEKPKQP